VVLLGYLLIAFKIWMLLDAIRRRIHVLWYVVVLVPFGDIVYFCAIKLRDFQARSSPQPSATAAREHALRALEQAASDTPSFDNRSRLAWALLEGGDPARARVQFELALASHRTDKEACLGLGLAELEAGDARAAVATLTPLVERALDYEQYTAALALAEALYRAGEKQLTIELLRNVCSDSRRVEHRLTLARYHLRGNHKVEARDTLQEALGEFESLPERLRPHNGAAATEARRLLRTLEHQLNQQLPSSS
jgi:hypothetical protein